MGGIEMKKLKTKMAIGAALLASVATGSLAYAQQKQIVFVAWGGATQEALEAAWVAPFTEKTGAKVISDGPTNYGKIKAMVDAGAVDWDVIDVEGDWAVRAARDGLLEKLDYSVIDTTNIDKKFYTEHGIGAYSFSFVLGYNTGSVSAEPTGWADFFDTQKFPGKRGMISWMTSGVLEMALLADGVKPEELYPLDVDRAFKKLDTIKKDLLFWDSGAASQSQIASGEVAMCFCWDARMGQLIADGAPVRIQWNQHLATMDYLVIPKGSKNKDLAMQFINIAASAEGQAKMAEGVWDGPINSKSKELIDPKIWEKVNAAYPDKAVHINLDFWRDHGEEVAARWTEWKVK